MAFLDMGLSSSNTSHFQHTTELGQNPNIDEDIWNSFKEIHKYDVQSCEQPKAKYA
jgi:hypothetical protein